MHRKTFLHVPFFIMDQLKNDLVDIKNNLILRKLRNPLVKKATFYSEKLSTSHEKLLKLRAAAST